MTIVIQWCLIWANSEYKAAEILKIVFEPWAIVPGQHSTGKLTKGDDPSSHRRRIIIIHKLSNQPDQVNIQGNADEYVWMYSQTIHKVDFNGNEMQGYIVEAYRLKL